MQMLVSFGFQATFEISILVDSMTTQPFIPTDNPKNRTISTFLKKTYDLLCNADNNDAVRWAPSGTGFVILDEDLFSKAVLPKYFKHSNYSSFIRQLNMYGFHKVRQSCQENYFYHRHFNMGEPEALRQIRRKPEKKKKRSNQSGEEEHSWLQSTIKPKKVQPISKKAINTQSKATFTCKKQVNNSHKKVVSQKNTENILEQGNCSIGRLPNSQSSNHLSMQLDQQQKIERQMPGFPTKQLINASKNNIFLVSVSVQNVNTSIMSIFY